MDRGVGTGFETIAHMLLEQKKMMDALEAENRDLRRQLADLRRGVGISIMIEGRTVSLVQEAESTLSPQVRQVPSTAASTETSVRQVPTPSEGGSNGRSKDTRGTTLADGFVL